MSHQQLTKISNKLPRNRKVMGLLLAGFVAVVGISAVLVSSRSVSAACAPATNYGSATQSVTVSSAGSYRVWTRLMAPSTVSNNYLLEVDGGTCYTVGGGSAIAANQWAWVDYQNGVSTTKVNLTLTAGTHSLKLVGNSASLKIDRILLLAGDGTCPSGAAAPTGNGDTCLVPPPTPTPPTVTMTAAPTSVTQGQPVTLSATASSPTSTVTSVGFYDGSTLLGTDTTAPYSIVWNTSTTTAAGAHSITAKATNAASLTGTSAATSVTVVAAPPVDTTPPKVTLTTPTNGSTLKGTVTISATATDNVKVASVTFSINGITIGSPVTTAGANNTYSTTLNTSSIADGSYTIAAKALDTSTSGNPATSSATVTIDNVVTPPTDTTPPVVDLTSPVPGTSPFSGTIPLSATATDNVAVASVSFSVDGTVVGTDTTAPYTLNWNTSTVANGSHTVVATATDTAGLKDTDQKSITVSNGDVLPPTTPTNLAAGAVSSTQIKLTWTASTDSTGVAGYYIVRNGATLAKTTGTGVSYADSTVTGSTTYSYYVYAYDAAGNLSPKSTTVTVTTPVKPDSTAPVWPTAGPKLVATAASPTQINLTWSAATDNVGVKGYQIFRNNGATPIAQVTTTSYGNSGLTANTTYTYTVKAIDAAGNLSLTSNVASATTQSNPTTGPGAIFGGVNGTDHLNSGIPGVSVRMTYSNSTHYFTTNSLGLYVFKDIPVGTYSVHFYANRYYSKNESMVIKANTTTVKLTTLTRR